MYIYNIRPILFRILVYRFITSSLGKAEHLICLCASFTHKSGEIRRDFSACSIAREKISEICATFNGTLVSHCHVSLILPCDKYRGCKGTGNFHNLRSRVDPLYSLFRVDPLLRSLPLCCCSVIFPHTFSCSLPSSLFPSFLSLFRCSFLSLLLWKNSYPQCCTIR